MTYQDFQSQILTLVSFRAPAGKSVTLHTVKKNNGVLFTGIFVQSHEPDFAAPVLYLEDFYSVYLKGEELETIADKIASVLFSSPGFSLNAKIFTDPEVILKTTMIRLLGTDRNRENLRTWLWRPYLDMAVTYMLRIENTVMGNGAVRLTKKMAEEAGLSEETVYRAALKNTEERVGECLGSLDELLGKEAVSHGIFYLSNRENLFGATAILYSRELKNAAEAMESNLFVLPSSVHEVILLPERGNDLSSLQKMVRDVNASHVAKEEILTDNVYLYDREADEIFFCV